MLEVEALSKRFGGLPALDDVTFGTGDGEIVAIVGPNGAGKSTLLKTIAGLYAPSSGTIRVAGESIGGLVAHRVRRKGVAVVMQTPLTFQSMSVLENAAIGAMFGAGGESIGSDEARRRARESLEFVGLADERARPVSSLNLHGQRFLELAKALAGRPRLLLVDEVMAGLNETEVAASIDILRNVRDTLGTTIVWVEHVMSAVIELAERAIVFDFGRVLAEGSPEIVMRDPNVVEAYLGQAEVA